MTYIENLLAAALQSGATKTGYNMDKTNAYIKERACEECFYKNCDNEDKEDCHRIYALSGTASWAYNEHGVIQYRNKAYRYEQSRDGYAVTHDPSYSLLR